MKYTKLDVFDHELPYKVWSIRNKHLMESRRKPALKTCLGLGAGLPEQRHQKLKGVDIDAFKHTKSDQDAINTPRKDRESKLKRRREDKALSSKCKKFMLSLKSNPDVHCIDDNEVDGVDANGYQ